MNEDIKNEILRHVAVGSPYFMIVAADKLLAINPFSKEEQAELLGVVDKWLRAFQSIVYYHHQIVKGVLPAVEELRTELAGPMPKGEHDDFFAEAFTAVVQDIQRAAPGFKPEYLGPKPGKPSKVPVPGPLDETLAIYKLASEDELRAQILAWRSSHVKGYVSPNPLFEYEGKPVFPFGIRERYYLNRKLVRTWVETKRWDVDNALAEDFVLVSAFLRGKLTCVSRTAISSALEPYVRKWDSWGCHLACRRAVDKLERDGALLRTSPRTWVPSPKGADAAKHLIDLWTRPVE